MSAEPIEPKASEASQPEPLQPNEPSPSKSSSRSSYTRKDARRDALLGVVIVAAVITAYFIGRHRRVSHLNAFAQCLAAKQVKMYGAYWCPHCADQKKIFGSSFQYVPYIECGVHGARTETPECVQAGIQHYPTWQFMNGERIDRVLPLQTLSEKAGCALP